MILELSTLEGPALNNYQSRPKNYHVALTNQFDKSGSFGCPVSEREQFHASVRMASKSFSFEIYKKTKKEKQELARAKALNKAIARAK
jgi:hypothetical protein